MIRLLPTEPLSMTLGSKTLVFDPGLVVIMLGSVFAYVLLGMLGTGLYKSVRWVLAGRKTARVLGGRIQCLAILLVLVYWVAC